VQKKAAQGTATKKGSARRTDDSGAGGTGAAEVGQDRLALVRNLIEAFAKELEGKQRKQRTSGVAELARLLALEKELSESTEAVREIKVTWVESGPAESSKSE